MICLIGKTNQMSSYKLSKKKKQHDDYLLCSRNFLTSEQNETPKTTKRRKTSNLTNPSGRKSTIQSVQKNKPNTFSKPANLQKKMKEKQSNSNEKTKKINLTRTKASHHYLSLTRIDQNEEIHKSKHTRIQSKTDHSLQKIF